MVDKIKCEICGKSLSQITHIHLRIHKINSKKYREMFPNSLMRNKYFCNNSSKRFKKLHSSGKMHNWCKGLTKEIDIRLKNAGEKVSKTRKRKFKSGELIHPMKNKVHPNKGKKGMWKASDETKKNIRKGRKKYFETHDVWNKGLYGEGNSMYGKKHKSETIQKMIENNYFNNGGKMSIEAKRKMSIAGLKRNKRKCFSKGGFRDDIGHYVRSRWEANICRFFNLLNIKYEYEPETFFLKNINYTPDFYLPNYRIYIEVKSFMDKISLNKIKAFNKALGIIGVDEYKKITNHFSNIIRGWEYG